MSDGTAPVSQANPTTTPPAQRPTFSLSLRARDLVNVAIFAVIYIVVVFAIASLDVISPLVMLPALLLSAVASGIPFMLFLTRVKRPGMVGLFGVVFALVCGLIGFGWPTVAVTLLATVLAEVILWVGRYRSRWAAIWACTVFSLWFVGPWVLLLIDRAGYLNSPAAQAYGPEYLAAFDRLVTVPVVWGYDVATLVCGFLGALLGSALLKKHFVRAGLA